MLVSIQAINPTTYITHTRIQYNQKPKKDVRTIVQQIQSQYHWAILTLITKQYSLRYGLLFGNPESKVAVLVYIIKPNS